MEIVHYTVMAQKVGVYLAPVRPNALIVDATLGEGGHSEMFLQRFPDIQVVGIDTDEKILEKAEKRLSAYKDRVTFYHSWFDEFFENYPSTLEAPDRVLFDFGVSMFHFKEADRGFSFGGEEKLDMRLNPDSGISAAEIVNTWDKKELEKIFFQYGEEQFSRRIAERICRERNENRITTSKLLAEIVRKAVPKGKSGKHVHPATRVFQALRITVNSELERIESGLSYSFQHLTIGGRIGAISFHSLEDRIVKHYFKWLNKSCICPENTPMCKCEGESAAKILTKKPIYPSDEEIQENPPSRSAKFRCIEKIAERNSR
ncbi:MAG: 16S rRNA (cytosine(1402)-N(4))-methyltransferase RsmH [Spirochaetia bacterium]